MELDNVMDKLKRLSAYSLELSGEIPLSLIWPDCGDLVSLLPLQSPDQFKIYKYLETRERYKGMEKKKT